MRQVATAVTAAPRQHDLRLAVVAVGVWAGTWSAGRWSVPAGVALVIMGAVVGAWGHRRRMVAAVVSAAAMGVAGGAIVAVGQVAVAKAVQGLPPVVVAGFAEVELTVSHDPREVVGRAEPLIVVAVRVDAVRWKGTTWTTSVRGVVFATEPERVEAVDGPGPGPGSADEGAEPGAAPPIDNEALDAGRQVREPSTWRDLLPGQRLTATGRVTPVSDRPGDLSAIAVSVRGPPRLAGSPSWWQTAAGALREGLREVCAGLPADTGGLLPGLVVGDVSNLPTEVVEDFRATGMSHLVAVSGSNVAVVVGAVLLLAGASGAGPRGRVLIGGVAIVGFAILARPEPSVLRASVMGAVGLFAVGFGRRGAAVPAVSAAVVVLLLADPALAGDLGFALSVSATLGLACLANRWSRIWQRRGWPAWLAVAVAVPLAAQLAVTPLLAAWEGRISLIAVPANALAAPAVPVATILGLFCCGVAVWWPQAGQLLAWLASWPTKWLIEVADHGAAVPVGSIPWPTGGFAAVCLAGVLLLAVVAARHTWGRVVLVTVLALGLFIGLAPVRAVFTGWPPRGWILVACDVGQGDAVVLSTGHRGSAVVVDVGPDPDLVDDCLRDLGVVRVPLLVLSHFHADHVAGIAGVYRDREVGRVLVPRETEPAGGVRRVTESVDVKNLPTAAVGTRFTAGDLDIEVLTAGDRFTGTRSDPNNDSVVVLARTAGVRMLLAGDIEEPAQRALLDSGVDLSAEVLKVPHHGSGYFEPRFLAAVAPRVGVISVGEHNEYGHPHPRVVAELSGMATTVLRTDLHGAVAVVSGTDGLEVARLGG